MNQIMGHSYENLDKAAQTMFELISDYVGVNSLCIIQTNEDCQSLLTHVYNRDKTLVNAGELLSTEDLY